MNDENFNKTHPELRDGEEFYLNCFKGDESRIIRLMSSREPEYTWRHGNVAYTPKGKVVETHSPTFRKKKQ